MNAHHYKAAYWVGRHVFDGLASFTEFESRVNDIVEEKDRGDVFEIFIEGYLVVSFRRKSPAKMARYRAPGECPNFCVFVIWSMLPKRSKDDDDFERAFGRVADGLRAT
jgi:hypothetical protein